MLNFLSQNTQNGNPIKGTTKEEVLKELKNILKNGGYIKVDAKYDNEYLLKDGDNFLQMGKNKKIYSANYNTPMVNLDFILEENGYILTLEDLRIAVDTVAELTLKNNIEENELEAWLND